MIKSINISTLGLVDLKGGYPNNQFIFQWDFHTISKKGMYQLRSCVLAHIYYDGDSWQFGEYAEHNALAQPPPDLLKTLVNYILSDAECMKRLEKWRNSYIKRLDKNIPKLSEKLYTARQRLNLLESADFTRV